GWNRKVTACSRGTRKRCLGGETTSSGWGNRGGFWWPLLGKKKDRLRIPGGQGAPLLPAVSTPGRKTRPLIQQGGHGPKHEGHPVPDGALTLNPGLGIALPENVDHRHRQGGHDAV